jgi:hypothetical protein
MKIDIISLFFNNETIIHTYETNIIKLCNTHHDIQFILIYNESKDNTLFELNKLQKKYNNVIVILSNSNGCSLGKNIGIKSSREECDYLFFLDSDITIDSSCINECINNIYPDIKFVGYYGGNDTNNTYIGGSYIYDTTIINQFDKTKYITAGCSLICKQFIKTNNLWFDEYYDPFIMQDVDFSYQVLKYSKIKKLIENNAIKHKQSSTTGQFNKLFYNWQLLKNSIHIMNKFNINKYNIFSQTPLKQFINLNILDMVVRSYSNYSVKLYSNRGKTLLYTQYKYLHFDNIDYNYEDNMNINIDEFIKLNNITTIIIDFQYYLKIYDKILLTRNVNIELIFDLKYIDLNNFDKIHNIFKIYTFYTIHELLLKHIFKNIILILRVKYKLLNQISNDNNSDNKKIHILLHYNNKYDKLYIFLNNIINGRIKITILYNNDNEIINNITSNDNNVYINLCNNNYYIDILKQLNVWIISTNNYPWCELINENINGNIINIDTMTYINNNNKLINDSDFSIDNIISFITKTYLL